MADNEIRYVAVGMTDVGQVREHNEDNFLAVDLAADARTRSATRRSSSPGGDVRSNMARTTSESRSACSAHAFIRAPSLCIG